MRKTVLIVAAIGMMSFGIGCDEEPAAPVTPPQATQQEAPAQGKSIPDQAKEFAAEGKQAVTAAIDQGKQAVATAVDEVKPQVEAAVAQAKEQVQQIAAFDYKAKLDEAAQYLKEKKIDLADKALTEVEAHKDSIPEAFHERLASLRKMVDTAKQAQGLGVNLPKF